MWLYRQQRCLKKSSKEAFFTLLDARPGRIDFKDREFRPQLVSLSSQYPSGKQVSLFLDQYLRSEMALDQGA